MPHQHSSLPCVLTPRTPRSAVHGALRSVPGWGAVPAWHSPSLYHSARGCTLFSSGVTSRVHLRVTVSPSLLKVTPNFSKNWTSKCMYGITDEGGTVQMRGTWLEREGQRGHARQTHTSPRPHAFAPSRELRQGINVCPQITRQSPRPQREGTRRWGPWKVLRVSMRS